MQVFFKWMKAKCSIHPIFSICVARSFLPALRIKPSLLKVAIEQFGIRSTNCRTQAQQGDHLSMGFPAFRVPEPPLGRRAVAHPPPCTSWAVLVSGKHPSVTIHKTQQSHSQHSSALECCRLNEILVCFGKKTREIQGWSPAHPCSLSKKGKWKVLQYKPICDAVGETTFSLAWNRNGVCF